MTAPAPLIAALIAHAEANPAHTALVAGEADRLSYHELADRVTALAAGLRAHGVAPGARVGVVGHKSTTAVTALLGVLAAGATYVPLDPRAPAARSVDLVRDADCALVLTGPADPLAAALGVPAADVDTVIAAGDGRPEPAPVTAEHIAYCMYTSGSTGRPKGVQIPHRALSAFFAAVGPLMSIEPDSRCLNTSALHFDVSVVDLLLPLFAGATVHLGPAFPVPPLLVALIERERITHLAAVGSTLALLAQHTNGFAGHDLSALRRVMTGAEVLDPRAVQAWLAAAPDLVVINGYGPTEATCLVTAQPITDREPDRTEHYPIGRPVAGAHIAFLDDEGGVDADGPGEILVAGDQVMTGYLNRPEEQQRAFRHVNEERFYRTGDRGRRRADGVILFEGRRDHEVKVRGYRVNLTEVCRAVGSHPRVGRAFAALVTDARGAQVLACAVVPHPAPAVPANGSPPDLGAVPAELDSLLRGHVADRLPGYMVPAAFHLLAAVPTLPSGKADTNGITAALAQPR